MHRRSLLGAAAAVGGASLSGCSFFGCQADTPIEEKAANPMEYASGEEQTIDVEGNVASVNEDWLVLDDDTGTAALHSGIFEEWIPDNVEDGRCLSGGGSYYEDSQSDHEADLVLYETYVDQ